MKRIGVLGGTFDPIHIGHLVAASEAHSQLALDQVLFIPAGTPWQKSEQDITPGNIRLELLNLAVARDDRFSVSDIEIKREGPSYSIDTFDELMDLDPAANFICLVGADVVSKIPTWHRWQDFVKKVSIAVVSRSGIAVGELPFAVTEVPIPEVAISASTLRQRYAAGEPTRYLIPDSVDEYIRTHGLYGAGQDEF